jgi:transcriptional regulator with XRE-family HTH domain
MTPGEIRAAFDALGLSVAQLAAMLEVTPDSLSRMFMDPAERSTARPAPVRLARLLRAYLGGHRPDDWPKPWPAPKPAPKRQRGGA